MHKEPLLCLTVRVFIINGKNNGKKRGWWNMHHLFSLKSRCELPYYPNFLFSPELMGLPRFAPYIFYPRCEKNNSHNRRSGKNTTLSKVSLIILTISDLQNAERVSLGRGDARELWTNPTLNMVPKQNNPGLWSGCIIHFSADTEENIEDARQNEQEEPEGNTSQICSA